MLSFNCISPSNANIDLQHLRSCYFHTQVIINQQVSTLLQGKISVLLYMIKIQFHADPSLISLCIAISYDKFTTSGYLLKIIFFQWKVCTNDDISPSIYNALKFFRFVVLIFRYRTLDFSLLNYSRLSPCLNRRQRIFLVVGILSFPIILSSETIPPNNHLSRSQATAGINSITKITNSNVASVLYFLPQTSPRNSPEL